MGHILFQIPPFLPQLLRVKGICTSLCFWFMFPVSEFLPLASFVRGVCRAHAISTAFENLPVFLPLCGDVGAPDPRQAGPSISFWGS